MDALVWNKKRTSERHIRGESSGCETPARTYGSRNTTKSYPRSLCLQQLPCLRRHRALTFLPLNTYTAVAYHVLAPTISHLLNRIMRLFCFNTDSMPSYKVSLDTPFLFFSPSFNIYLAIFGKFRTSVVFLLLLLK